MTLMKYKLTQQPQWFFRFYYGFLLRISLGIPMVVFFSAFLRDMTIQFANKTTAML